MNELKELRRNQFARKKQFKINKEKTNSSDDMYFEECMQRLEYIKNQQRFKGRKS